MLANTKIKNYFVVGDILGLSFRIKGLTYFFEGICIALRSKNFKQPGTSFIMRNILSDVGIELNCAFFYIRAFSVRINKYKRKHLFYSRSKLYYIRHKLNKASRVV